MVRILNDPVMTDNKADTISCIKTLRDELKAAKNATFESIKQFEAIRKNMNDIALQGTLECSQLKADYQHKINELQHAIRQVQYHTQKELTKLRR